MQKDVYPESCAFAKWVQSICYPTPFANCTLTPSHEPTYINIPSDLKVVTLCQHFSTVSKLYCSFSRQTKDSRAEPHRIGQNDAVQEAISNVWQSHVPENLPV